VPETPISIRSGSPEAASAVCIPAIEPTPTPTAPPIPPSASPASPPSMPPANRPPLCPRGLNSPTATTASEIPRSSSAFVTTAIMVSSDTTASFALETHLRLDRPLLDGRAEPLVVALVLIRVRGREVRDRDVEDAGPPGLPSVDLPNPRTLLMLFDATGIEG